MADRILINKIHIPIRWVDLDAYGHVNNARFFDYMTEARASLLGEMIAMGSPYQYILVDASCNFKRSYSYLQTAVINQYLESIGNSSFSLSYTFHSQQEPEVLYAEGQAKMVCFDPKLRRPIRVPDVLRELLISNK